MPENLLHRAMRPIFAEDRGAAVKDICPKLGDLLEDVFFEANSLFFEIAFADDIAAI